MIFLFDFDSTLFPFESLEDLISQSIKGKGNQKKIQTEMSQISDLAMNGEFDFKTSLEKRIGLSRLYLRDMKRYYQLRKGDIDGQIINLIKNLKRRHPVYIISGGFIEYLELFAIRIFELERNQLYANQFEFDTSHQVIGFNQNLPLVKSDGKVEVAQLIKKKHPNEKMVMIGDGYTDWLVFENGIADAFIGVGFYKSRKKVKEKLIESSQKFAYSIDQLCNFLNQYQ